jgi:threonine synthase
MSPVEMGSDFVYRCAVCSRSVDADEAVWRCYCGGLLELGPPAAFDRSLIDTSEHGFWRYSAALPRLYRDERIRLGDRVTPLVETDLYGRRVYLKLDYLLPTGSYKDRGAAVLMARLRRLGITDVMDDSSGNAGAAAAAYAAAAGMKCTIYVPAGNSQPKLAQIAAYGAHLVTIAGSRAAVADAVGMKSRTEFYASHVWHPLYPAGVATLGYEIWEQLGYQAPRALVVPAGQGSLVLGLARAFEALVKGRAIETPPAIIAVQSEAFPALAQAFKGGTNAATGSSNLRTTVAEGIACERPARIEAVLAALRASRGRAITVSEDDIQNAFLTLSLKGFYVEPTSAVAAAGFKRAELDGTSGVVVVVLTGNGLKSWRPQTAPPPID